MKMFSLIIHFFQREELHPGGVLPGFFLSRRNRPGSHGAVLTPIISTGARTSRNATLPGSTQPPPRR